MFLWVINVIVFVLFVYQVVATVKRNPGTQHVNVYHFNNHRWDSKVLLNTTLVEYPCETIPNITCEFAHSEKFAALEELRRRTAEENQGTGVAPITVGLYNVHQWENRHRKYHRDGFMKPFCGLRTELAMIESVESHARFTHSLFRHSFHNFDGNATTSKALSSVQRTYSEAYMEEALFRSSVRARKDLISGASFIASNCHPSFWGNKRNGVVLAMREAGFRVDGLGGCLSTKNNLDPHGQPVEIPPRPLNIGLLHEAKMEPLSRYMFHLAFENTIEEGYVTEKIFDALFAGTVPVFLGDAETARPLLPDPMAAIFVADFPDTAALVRYLRHLIESEEEYEKHRSWRHSFDRKKHIAARPKLQKSFQCQVCEWAVSAKQTIAMPDRKMTLKKCLSEPPTPSQRKEGWS